MPRRVVVLTGDSGVGKTTICKALVAAAVKRGYRCAGLLCDHVIQDGQRVGTNAIDLATGRCRELTRTDRELSNLRVGRWSFNPATLEWGNALLRGMGECDLLIVDEIGRLEIDRGAGWVDAWGALERGRFAMAVVIVRPSLAERVCNLLAARDLFVATRASRDELPMQFLNTLDTLVTELRSQERRCV